jgi:hypothetical protein
MFKAKEPQDYAYSCPAPDQNWFNFLQHIKQDLESRWKSIVTEEVKEEPFISQEEAFKLLSETVALASDNIRAEDQAKVLEAVLNDEAPQEIRDLTRVANEAFEEIRKMDREADEEIARID